MLIRQTIFILVLILSGCDTQPDIPPSLTLPTPAECPILSGLTVSDNGDRLTVLSDQEEWRITLQAVVAGEKNSNRVIVVLPGGPSDTSPVPATTKQLKRNYFDLTRDSDTFVVERSATGSSHSFEILEQFGLNSFDCDAVLLRRSLSHLRGLNPRKEVVVIASSFSGLLGMNLYLSGMVDRLVLVAPWVNVQKHSKMTGSALMNGRFVSIEDPRFEPYYNEFNKNYFKIDVDTGSGPGVEWMLQLKTAFSEAKNKNRVMILETSLENRHDVDASNQYFRSAGFKCYVLAEGIIHEAMLVHKDNVRLITDFIEYGDCPS